MIAVSFSLLANLREGKVNKLRTASIGDEGFLIECETKIKAQCDRNALDILRQNFPYNRELNAHSILRGSTREADTTKIFS